MTSATPASSTVPVTCLARLLRPAGALPIATPNPAQRTISSSLLLSPMAQTCARGAFAHPHPDSCPANHILVVAVVADGATLRLGAPEPVRHHGERPGFGHLGIDDFDEPIKRPGHPGDVPHPGGQFVDPGRHIFGIQVDEHHLGRILAYPPG